MPKPTTVVDRMRWANATIPERTMMSKPLVRMNGLRGCMRHDSNLALELDNEYRSRFLGTVQQNHAVVNPRADLRIAAVIQFFNHPLNIEAIAEPLLRSAFLHELVVNVDDKDKCSQLLWRQRLGTRPGDMVLLSNNVHELRAYNRGISLTESELVLLLQDDDIPPLDDEWLLNAIRLFVALPKLAVLSGLGGWIDGKTVQRWEFADLQTYNNMISWPLPYEVDGVPFMPVSCGYLSPLFLRRTFLDAHYKQFDKNLSDPGEPGIGLDCDVSYSAWENNCVTGVYPAPFARGIGGHGTQIGKMKAVRARRTHVNTHYLSTKYDLSKIARRAVRATEGLALRQKHTSECWNQIRESLCSDWNCH